MSAEDLPPPPPSRGRDQAVWVGLFLILGLTATLGALFVLTDAALFRGRYVVTTHVPDAGGIRRADPVRMRGVNIGRVQRFRIAPEGVEIRLEIEGEYAIPADSHVELKSQGLLGGMIMDVIPGRSAQSLANGATIPGRTGEGVLETSSRIAKTAETVMSRLETLLSQQTIENVQASTGDLKDLLRRLSRTVEKQDRQLTDLTESLKGVTSDVERVTGGPELERTVKRLDGVAERLDGAAQAIDRSSRSLETVLARIEGGEGSLGKAATDQALYDNLNEAAKSMKETSSNLSKLADDIRKHPKRYLKLSLF